MTSHNIESIQFSDPDPPTRRYSVAAWKAVNLEINAKSEDEAIRRLREYPADGDIVELDVLQVGDLRIDTKPGVCVVNGDDGEDDDMFRDYDEEDEDTGEPKGPMAELHKKLHESGLTFNPNRLSVVLLVQSPPEAGRWALVEVGISADNITDQGVVLGRDALHGQVQTLLKDFPGTPEVVALRIAMLALSHLPSLDDLDDVYINVELWNNGTSTKFVYNP